MYHYGRPKTTKKPEKNTTYRAAGLVLGLGCVMVTAFFLHTILPQKTETSLPADAIAVMSTAVTDEPRETVTTPAERYHTGAEPFGYMDGEWNLWEYIGDLMVSLLS